MLPILTAGLLIGGYFLSGLSRPLLTNVGLALLPLFLALLLQHRVCFVSRERKIADIPKEPVAPRPSKRNEIRRALKSRPSTVER
jgi:uncharacterized membrane protein